MHEAVAHHASADGAHEGARFATGVLLAPPPPAEDAGPVQASARPLPLPQGEPGRGVGAGRRARGRLLRDDRRRPCQIPQLQPGRHSKDRLGARRRLRHHVLLGREGLGHSPVVRDGRKRPQPPVLQAQKAGWTRRRRRPRDPASPPDLRGSRDGSVRSPPRAGRRPGAGHPVLAGRARRTFRDRARPLPRTPQPAGGPLPSRGRHLPRHGRRVRGSRGAPGPNQPHDLDSQEGHHAELSGPRRVSSPHGRRPARKAGRSRGRLPQHVLPASPGAQPEGAVSRRRRQVPEVQGPEVGPRPRRRAPPETAQGTRRESSGRPGVSLHAVR